MVQMTISDQQVIKAIPGNNICADCPTKSPQWASLSFGVLVCLECSGKHRGLGVHISFVRSVQMDSWTEAQIALMREGGNKACNNYLSKQGLLPSTPIKQKYESQQATLYKEVLKARVAGLPEPTSLPTPAPRSTGSARSTGSMGSGGSVGSDRGDPNGMERLKGESEAEYVVRQTRLRDEAKQRMASKFGGGGIAGAMSMSSMSGMGSNSGRMAGIGSDSSYNPNTGGYGAGAGLNVDVDSVVAGLGSAFATLGSYGQQGVSTISSLANDPNLKENVNRSYSSGLATGASMWSSFTAAASQVASTITEPEEDDGLADFQRRMHEESANRSAASGGTSRYSGFGSDDVMGSKGKTSMGANKVQKSQEDLLSFNEWGNEDSFATTSTAAPVPVAPIINTPAPVPDPPKVPITKQKVDGTGEDFFSNFGA